MCIYTYTHNTIYTMYAHEHMYNSYTVITLPDCDQIFRLSKADKNSCVGSEIAVLRKTCLKGWPLAGIWKLGFQEGSHNFLIRLEWLIVSKHFMQTIRFMLNTCFPSGSLEFFNTISSFSCEYPQTYMLALSL